MEALSLISPWDISSAKVMASMISSLTGEPSEISLSSTVRNLSTRFQQREIVVEISKTKTLFIIS